MPVHDWSRVPAGVFHTFHQDWTVELYRALNRGVLPPGYAALTDLRGGGGGEPDVYVSVPLEVIYAASWAAAPALICDLVMCPR